MPFWSTKRKIGLSIVQLNKDHYSRMYIDDIFVLFNSTEYLKRFCSYLNFCHLNISLTIENEKDNRMSFLDINIIRGKDKFTTSFYRKPTFSGICTHFDSFLPSSDKIGLLHAFLYRFSGFAVIELSFTYSWLS